MAFEWVPTDGTCRIDKWTGTIEFALRASAKGELAGSGRHVESQWGRSSSGGRCEAFGHVGQWWEKKLHMYVVAGGNVARISEIA
jgi:hypothetical protein